ncbi:hypothetical protein AX774_g3207, partial [Zancudomyces culisetae]
MSKSIPQMEWHENMDSRFNTEPLQTLEGHLGHR